MKKTILKFIGQWTEITPPEDKRLGYKIEITFQELSIILAGLKILGVKAYSIPSLHQEWEGKEEVVMLVGVNQVMFGHKELHIIVD
jgi:hypothetical protein